MDHRRIDRIWSSSGTTVRNRTQIDLVLAVAFVAALVAVIVVIGGSDRPALASTTCEPGTYQAGTGCVPADPGFFVAVPAATAQTPCQPGTYQPAAGSVSCEIADPGFFVAAEAATEQTPCQPGTYQPAAGSISCLRADPGFFVELTGSAEQTACPPGFTSLFAGAIECTAIEAGYVFSGFSSPVDVAPTLNVVKAGQAVPLRFHVSDANGNPVTDLTDVTITVTSLACSAGTTSDQLEEVATGGSGLQNLGDGNYQFNWKTPKSYASSCKTMSLDLGDGSAHSALFQFRK